MQAAYQDMTTPITPGMVPIIIKTGASIFISPHVSDFEGPLQPAQSNTLKGIASRLPVAGIRTVKYTIQNDENETQTILLQDCLHVPTCTVRLLPRQIGSTTGLDDGSFYATHANPTLVITGKLQRSSTTPRPTYHCFLLNLALNLTNNISLT